jgi:hypothetical protein
VKAIGALVLLLPAGSVDVITGLLAIPLAGPVQVTGFDVAGFGVQVVPGMVLLVPSSTVQEMLTEVLPEAELGVATQPLGAVGGVVSTTNGTVPVLVRPEAVSVTVTGGLLPKAVPVPLQVTVPGGEPEQVAFGMVTVEPAGAPVQVMVTAVLPLARLGDATHTGNAGDEVLPMFSGMVPLLERPVAGSVMVSVGLLAKFGLLVPAVPVQVNAPLAGTGLGVQVAPGMLAVLPGVAPVQLMVTAAPTAIGAAGVEVQTGNAGGLTGPDTFRGSTAEVVLPAGSVTRIGGLLPNVAPVPPVHENAPPAGTGLGEQVAPGIVTVSPAVPPVQLIVTLADGEAGLGVAVQTGATGGVTSTTYGTVAVVGDAKPGVVTDAVGLAATELGLVDVHTTLPPVLGLGTQVVPGMLNVLPEAMLVQVITVFTVRFDGLGVAVQVGAGLAPV